MKTSTTLSILLALAAMTYAVPNPSFSQSADALPKPVVKPTKQALPRMVDYGADKCVPCKTMAPILKELQAEFAGKVEVVFVDVWKDREAGRDAKIKLIPTQVFFDVKGKELARHQGFMSKEEILAEWQKHGFLPAVKK